MMERATTIEAHLAARLRSLRARRGQTLDGLAARSGVSRSMISLIERGESSPTASVLDKLAASLGVTLAALFAEEERPGADPVSRHADQTAWRDPGTGYVRRNLSPAGFPSPIELVEVKLPPQAHVAYENSPRPAVLDQQVWVLEGALEVRVGETTHRLAAGDCLAMRVDRPTGFHNPGPEATRYLVALSSSAGRSRAKGAIQV